MKTTVENLSTTRVKLLVDVPFDEIKSTFDAAYKQLGSQVRIPGFRPGKVPARVLEARIGRAAVLDEVMQKAIPEKYSEAVTEHKIKLIGQPQIEIVELGDDAFSFSAEVEVRPDFEIPSTDDVTVTVDDVNITDEDIDTEIDNMRDRFSTLKSVDRAVQEGDFVSIDLVAKVGGQDVEGGTANGLSYEVGSKQLVDGIDEALVGLNEGDEKTFTSQLVAGDEAGQDADVTVTVKSVKEKELPEVDDEFAQLASEFDTIGELRDDLRERLHRVRSVDRIGTARDKVVEALLSKTEFDVPEDALTNEIESREHDAVHSFDHNEDALNAWIAEQGKTREEFDAETKETAEKSLRAQILLDAISDDKDIQVDEGELTNHIIRQAQRYGMAPQQFTDEIARAGQLTALMADARRNKTLQTLLDAATVKEESGATLDLNAIQAEAIAALTKAREQAQEDAIDDELEDELYDNVEIDDEDDDDEK